MIAFSSFQSHENVFRLDHFQQETPIALSNKSGEDIAQDVTSNVAPTGYPLGLDLQQQEEEIADLKAIIEQLKMVSITLTTCQTIISKYFSTGIKLQVNRSLCSRTFVVFHQFTSIHFSSGRGGSHCTTIKPPRRRSSNKREKVEDGASDSYQNS